MQPQFSSVPPKPPTAGRAGFFTVLVMWVLLLYLLFFGEGRVDHDLKGATMPMLGWGSIAVGILSAVVSFFRGEQRGFAITTLWLVFLGPLALFALLFVALLVYGMALS